MGYTPPYLEVRKITGGWNIFPPTLATGDDLTISPNGTDVYPYIQLLGNGQLLLNHQAANPIYMVDSGIGRYLGFNYATPDVILTGYIANKNIFLNPTGTGVVKFGTYTAGAATDSTGYITILDAAGNTRKLMVQA